MSLASPVATEPSDDSTTSSSLTNSCRHDDELRDCHARWLPFYQPTNAYEHWVFEQLVVNTVRMERCQLQDRAVECLLASRACLLWEEDRRLAVEEIAAGLARRPGLVARRLRKSKHGVEWLIARWQELGSVLDRGESLSEPQAARALDLLGIANDQRGDFLHATRETHVEVLNRELNRLVELAEELEELDQQERKLAELRMAVETPKPVAVVRRYEAACWKRVQWAMNELKGCRTNARHFRRSDAGETPRARPMPERVEPGRDVETESPEQTAMETPRDEFESLPATFPQAPTSQRAVDKELRHLNRRQRRAIARQAKQTRPEASRASR